MARRINARIDDAIAQDLEEIRAITRETTTEALRSAITHYRETLEARGGHAASILRDTGFIGIGSGPKDLSVDYKQVLSRSLSAKTANRKK